MTWILKNSRITVQRQRPELDKCKTCGRQLYFATNNGMKKVWVNGKKHAVQEKDYCDLSCSKRKIVFFQRIEKILKTEIHLRYCQIHKSNYLVAQYVLWKMLRRTPITSLEMILETQLKKIEVKYI